MAHDLQSLITVLDGVLEEDQWVLSDCKKALVESLLEKVTSLKDLLEKSATLQLRLRGNNREIIQELQSEIRDMAHEAEDVIESHALLDQTHPKKSLLKSLLKEVTSLKTKMLHHLRCKSCTSSCRSNEDIIQELHDKMGRRDAVDEPEDTIESHAVCHSVSKVTEKFDAASDKVMDIINHQSHDEGEPTMDVIYDHSLSVAADKTNTALMMVGFEEDALRLKGRLTSDTRKREIIPIVGMGGIGKTTLARNLYDDPLVVSHFDLRAWVTVSQDYDVWAILSGLLGSISGNISEDMLGDTLYRRLYGKRYLVVLDDIWSEKAWDEIQRYFPKQESRSRILITSRELHVAKHVDSACEEHQMHLLSEAQSWDLFRQKVFEEDEYCPRFLEQIGRKIASDCRGLPLAISVIGGLLSVDKYSKDLWSKVARDVRSITNDHISEILCLSYDNLPLHLKPCFLYMSAFPEDYAIERWILVIKLVAEGFIWRSNGENNKSLEDLAEEYLKALVDRNLLSVTKKHYDGQAISYGMHDLLRDLCVNKAAEDKFLCIFKRGEHLQNFRRVSIVHRYNDDDAPDLAGNLSCSRSLLYIGPKNYYLPNISSSILSSLRLVRVLDVCSINFRYKFPKEILKLGNLRFLAVRVYDISPPPAIWRLRNLQTVLVYTSSDDALIIPREAWEISGLRHIILKSNFNTSIHFDFQVARVHENLQTISSVHLYDFLARNLINNIPNIKRLGLCCDTGFTPEGKIELSHLHKLEDLALDGFRSVGILSLLKLPDCLKNLSLLRCILPMGFVNGVGDLQHLEELVIIECRFRSEEHSEEEEEEEEEEWELNEGVEFCSLQVLKLRRLAIKRWKADCSHFPVLQHLIINRCRQLEEIPSCFGEMPTLETINVDENNPSHVDWANEVRRTQRDEYGNESLQICFE